MVLEVLVHDQSALNLNGAEWNGQESMAEQNNSSYC